MDKLLYVVSVVGMGLASLQFSSGMTTESSSQSSVMADEVAKNSLVVTLYSYRVSLSKWDTISSDFSTVIQEETNSHCAADPAGCGLTAGWAGAGSFQSVVFESATESDTKPEIFVTFYVELPAISSTYFTATQYVLTYSALYDIVRGARGRLNDVTDGAVLGIGDATYTPPPDTLMNEVMIAVAIVLLIVVCALAIGGHFYTKKQEKEEKLKAKFGKKENSSKVCPSPEAEVGMTPAHSQQDVKQENGKVAIGNDASEMDTFHDDLSKHRHPRVILESELGDKANGNEGSLVPANQLPPLSRIDESPQRRRKQHKKKKSKRELDQNADGFGPDERGEKSVNSPASNDSLENDSVVRTQADQSDVTKPGDDPKDMPSVTEL